VNEADHIDGGDVDEESKAPWHFKLLMIALVIYLGYRLVQGIDWLLRWAF
jgi:hypothetical protein